MADKGRLSKFQIQQICEESTMSANLLSKFEEKNGKFFKKRLEEEIRKRKLYCSSRRKSRSYRNKKNVTYVEHALQRMGNANANANANDNVLKDDGVKGKKEKSFYKNPPKSDLFREFFDFHLHYTNQKYVSLNEGKDMGLLNKLIKELGEEEVRERIDRFFKFPNDFILKQGFSVGVFYSQINFLIEKKPIMTETQRKNIASMKALNDRLSNEKTNV
jgi:hypothetical protein